MANYKGTVGIEFLGEGYDVTFNFDFTTMMASVHRFSSLFSSNDEFDKDRKFPLYLSNLSDMWLEFYIDRTTIEHLTVDKQVYTMSKFGNGKSREIISISSSNNILFDYEYYQIEAQRKD